MTDTYELLISHITEHPIPGKRLGRHQRHDSRNLLYPAFRGIITDTDHPRHTAILDQGDLGSCTGNAVTGALGTDPVFGGLPATHPVLNEAFAVKVYEAATHLDSVPGSYPPDDTGSDGGSACQAAKNLGQLSGYTWAFGIDHALAALVISPICFGVNWYDSFDNPDSSGLIKISSGASVRGGHEFVARRFDAARNLIGCDNSWGASWGVAGSFWIPVADMDRLLSEGGDCVVPVPVSAPAPTPDPGPTPTPPNPNPSPHPDDAADQMFATTLLADDRPGHPWLDEHHVAANGRVARAAQAWVTARGYR